jgi:hypothetical protein
VLQSLWGKEQLPGMRKGDKVKVLPARRLRRETTMSLKSLKYLSVLQQARLLMDSKSKTTRTFQKEQK